MKNIALIILTSIYCLSLFAQNQDLSYSRVKIDLSNHHISDIAKLGLEVDHGEYVKNKYIINDFSNYEIDLLKSENIGYEILIEDVQQYYVHQNHFGHDHGTHDDVTTRTCLLYTSPSPRDATLSRMPSSA